LLKRPARPIDIFFGARSIEAEHRRRPFCRLAKPVKSLIETCGDMFAAFEQAVEVQPG